MAQRLSNECLGKKVHPIVQVSASAKTFAVWVKLMITISMLGYNLLSPADFDSDSDDGNWGNFFWM